jgi:hypothetical protein
MNLHTLVDGFTTEDPALLIPWGLSRKDLIRLLEPHGLKQVTPDVYALSCTALNGIPLKLSFRFDSHYGKQKYLLSLDRIDQCDLRGSFEEFQRHLEATFGEPTTTKNGEEGFTDYEWRLGIYSVTHGVYEFHELREAVLISPPYQPTSSAAQLFDSLATFFRFVVLPFLPCLIVIAMFIYWIIRRMPKLW